MKITALVCPKCKDTIFSRTRHDMRFCSCGTVAIDGGFDYCKVSGKPPLEFKELDLDVTERELYDDYNTGADIFGLIKGTQRRGKNAKG